MRVEQGRELTMLPGMKHHRLRAVAHNLADSLASGLCFVIGYHPVDVFAEAASSVGGVIEVDFLRGEASRGAPSESLQAAIRSFREILPSFCEKHGVAIGDFRRLSASYGLSLGYEVYVEDRNGLSSKVRYVGNPGQRPLVKDQLRRVRRVPVRIRHAAEGAARSQ